MYDVSVYKTHGVLYESMYDVSVCLSQRMRMILLLLLYYSTTRVGMDVRMDPMDVYKYGGRLISSVILDAFISS